MHNQEISEAGPSKYRLDEYSGAQERPVAGHSSGALPSGASNQHADHSDYPLQHHSNEPTSKLSGAGTANEPLSLPETTPEPYVLWIGDLTSFGVLPQYLFVLCHMIPLALIPTEIALFFVYISGSWPQGEGMASIVEFVIQYSFVLFASLVSWMPAPIVYVVYRVILEDAEEIRAWAKRRKIPWPESAATIAMWLNLVAGLIIFGLIAWAYCAIVASDDSNIFTDAWWTGTMPKPPFGCETRVAPQQASLFTADVYKTQFARAYPPSNGSGLEWVGIAPVRKFSPFDIELSQSIQNNQTLCGQGFVGNTDLYGVGIRSGVYLQWVSSLLANNFLSNARQEIQKVYLIFSLAICLSTVISGFTGSCIFSIEIEMLYWMYWGGYICVFGTAPCPIRLDTASKWVQIDWTTAVLFCTHSIMVYHGIWFIWHGYDQTFPRMPCGTNHFFLVPALDPSKRYWVLRDWLTMLVATWFPFVLPMFPFIGLLLIPEVKHAVQSSAPYQAVFREESAEEPGPEESLDPVAERPSLWRRLYNKAKEFQGGIRETVLLPAKRRGGIRLVTPVDVEYRRFLRIRWATTGLFACVLSIIAIELILKWNKIEGVNSLRTTGQYVPFIIGVASLISVIWHLVQQDSERRLHRVQNQTASETDEGYELSSLPSVISHAFAQPDVGYLSNDGALPVSLDNDEEDIADVRLS